MSPPDMPPTSLTYRTRPILRPEVVRKAFPPRLHGQWEATQLFWLYVLSWALSLTVAFGAGLAVGYFIWR